MLCVARLLPIPALLGVLALLAGCPAAPKPSASPTVATAATPLPRSAASSAPLEPVAAPSGTFFTLPYLQLGDAPTQGDTMAVVWHAAGSAATNWTVETRSPAGNGAWTSQGAPQTNTVALSAVAAHTVYTATLAHLIPGAPFDYRVVRNGKPVFAARANRARPAADQEYHLAVFGDCAEDTAWQRKVAYQTSLLKPDAVLITGDIVYPHGRASEYRDHFFPIYNAETASPRTGGPLLRSTLFIGASGNHDLDYANLNRYPDALAYYYYWKQPWNGWGADSGRSDKPPVSGPNTAFRTAAGKAFPYGANFSFRYGNTHFVVIDSNYYMNWEDPTLQQKLRDAIDAGKDATWRFVVFHVPPFHSSDSHQEEQWMRVLCPLFEECGVDMVLSGHVHNYERTHPMRFAPRGGRQSKGRVDGEWTLDTAYDGTTTTRPDGILYVITGAGGAALYTKPYHKDDPSGTVEPYTAKYVADTHSLTLLDMNNKSFTVRQISEDGKEIDRFTVTKP